LGVLICVVMMTANAHPTENWQRGNTSLQWVVQAALLFILTTENDHETISQENSELN